MRGHTDRILASTALALVLGLSSPALAQSVSPEERARVEARVPVPDTSLPPPPTASDVMKSVSVGTTAPAGDRRPPRPSLRLPHSRHRLLPHPSRPPSRPPRNRRRNRPRSPSPSPTRRISDRLRDLITGRNADRYSRAATSAPPRKPFTRNEITSRSGCATASSRRRAAAAVSYLQNVDADGLDPSDYPIAAFKAGDVDALADAELRLTGEILEYARHASLGRVHFSRISNDIGYDRDAPEPAEILAKVSAPPT